MTEQITTTEQTETVSAPDPTPEVSPQVAADRVHAEHAANDATTAAEQARSAAESVSSNVQAASNAADAATEAATTTESLASDVRSRLDKFEAALSALAGISQEPAKPEPPPPPVAPDKEPEPTHWLLRPLGGKRK